MERRLVILLTLTTLCSAMETSGSETAGHQADGTISERMQTMLDTLTERLDVLGGALKDLAQQTMLQQFAVEERVRSEGNSGVKQIRGKWKGPENYYEATHVANGFMSIHDHCNYDRTLGMGEVMAILNGVEFRTRHNDYRLVMPSTTSGGYHVTEDIPFPGVPEEVTKLKTVEEQIREMRLWFKAFQEQNSTVRDYRKFFKPVLCYMEGAWTLDRHLEEPFASDRHRVQATSWEDLHSKILYASLAGTKDPKENLAYLPTTIIGVNETTGVPTYAQWNYRIVCSPVKEEIPLTYFKQVDDLSYRLSRGRTPDQVRMTSSARFQLYDEKDNRFTTYSLIDRLFFNVPGKDNIPGNLTQVTFGRKMYDMRFREKKTFLNTGYYHRWYLFKKPSAGLIRVARGFNDANLWMAQTTQSRVAPTTQSFCSSRYVDDDNDDDIDDDDEEEEEEEKKKKSAKRNECETRHDRFSYAIPLEIVFLNPLLSWNPHGIAVHQNYDIVTARGRDGSSVKPYNGTDTSHYYLTPQEFFSGKMKQKEQNNNDNSGVHVLDRKGIPRKTSPSGLRVLTHPIKGVGIVRLRYPIAPVHGEGSAVWKELNALKTMTAGTTSTRDLPRFIKLKMSRSTAEPPGAHTHQINLPYLDYRRIVDVGEEIEVETSTSHGHSHTLVLRYIAKLDMFKYEYCDSASRCRDRHPRAVFRDPVP